MYCTLLYTHQYTDNSVFLSHFILLTWYQSHSSDFLVPMDISGVLPLPSPSSSSHCQKRITIVTPISLQLSDLIVLLIQLLKQRHRVIEQTIPRKTQPRTARNHLTRTLTRQLKFLPYVHALHAPPRSVTRDHALTRTSCARIIAITHHTRSHVPHAPATYRGCQP